MRSGGYTLQQSLTPEAASIIKQAVSLARRRGHAQVTPLHVASSMLASSTGLLKRACLQSHSHPLQCKALELCFNVALNRLPTSASSPLLSPHSHFPSLSNALVAAFKRAQAHQRRGSIENQQQPILALKVEIEQLVISVLDDPSVSRVMREAGFSSTQVKSNVEQAVSNLEVSNNNNSKTKELIITKPFPQIIMPTISSSSRLPFTKSSTVVVQNDDVLSVLEAMIDKKTKNTVIIGECVSTAESVVKGLIDKFDKKEVPYDMRSVQFISVPLLTLRNISKEEFEVRVGELRALVKSYMNSGVVLYLGDLQWVSEFWSKYCEEKKMNYSYCPVEYMIMELSRLICGSVENKRLWLMGIATFQTYAKCKTRRPSLESLWSLHPLTIPVGNNLALSLSLDSVMLKKEPVDDFNWLFEKGGLMKKNLSCCTDCLENFKREAQAIMTAKQEFFTTTSKTSLPSWLQQFKDENRKQANFDDQEVDDKIEVLCKKWNSICSSVHKKKPHFLEKAFNIPSPSSSPSSSTSISSNSQTKSKLHQTLLNWPVIFEPITTQTVHDNDENYGEISKPCLGAEIGTKPELLSNPNSSPNSASSSEASQELMDFSKQFKELNSDSLNILCHALEKKVPWQNDLIPEIATTVLRCRSGMMSHKKKIKFEEIINREESWLFFLGSDSDGKETIAKELAKTVFGSYDDFVTISSFSATKADSSTDEEAVSKKKKRGRDENGGSSFERFVDAVRDNPSRLFHVEDVDQLDDRSLKGFERAIGDGFLTLPDEKVLLKDAIVIFSCESYFSTALQREGSACSPPTIRRKIEKEKDDDDLMEKKQCGIMLDLNIATDQDDENSVSEIRIFDLVDMQVDFKIQVL